MNTEDLAYLRGEKFSNHYEFRSIRDVGVQSRLDILKTECAGKRVIHLGAADHKGLIASKISAGIWLHGVISEVASECVGVDVDADVVAHVTREHGVANMIPGNIFDDAIVESFRSKGEWDVMLLGEILEHIPNPVQFLSDIRQKYSGTVREIIITVPNALRISNFLNAFRGFEAINTDHKFWFTPYTLASVSVSAGLSPKWVAPCHYVWQQPRRRFLQRTLQTRCPFFRDCFVMNTTV